MTSVPRIYFILPYLLIMIMMMIRMMTMVMMMVMMEMMMNDDDDDDDDDNFIRSSIDLVLCPTSTVLLLPNSVNKTNGQSQTC